MVDAQPISGRAPGTIAKNLIVLLASQMATWVMTMLVLVAVPRLLGAEDFGSFVFASTYVSFFAIVVNLGIALFLTKEVARDHNLLQAWVGNAVRLKLVLAITLSVVALLLAVILGNDGVTLILILVCCFQMLLNAVNDIYRSGLQALERMARPAIYGVLEVYVGGLAGILVLVAGGDVVAYAVVVAVTSVVPLFANYRQVRPMMHGRTRIDFGLWRVLFRGGLPLFTLGALNLVYGQIDVPILEAISGSTVVGWYGVAYRWVGIPVFITTAVVGAFFPAISAAGKEGRPEFADLTNRCLQIVAVVSVPAALGLAVLAEDIITFFYNDEFDNSVPVMQILALHIPLAGIDTILAMSLIAADRQRRYVYVAAAAAIVSPIACLIAIPATDRAFDNGAIGAAIVTVSIEVFIMVGALLMKRRGVFDRPTVVVCLRYVAAGLLMAAVLLFAAPSWPMFVAIPLGIVLYAVGLFVFRAVTVGEVHEMYSRGLVSLRRTSGE